MLNIAEVKCVEGKKGKERRLGELDRARPDLAESSMMPFESPSATAGCDSKGLFLVPYGNRF